MRIAQKEELIKSVSVLCESHEYIEKLILSENKEVLSDFLTECQQCAIDIGTIIEKHEGEGTSAVKCLEDYCELLYQFSIDEKIWLIDENELYKEYSKEFETQLNETKEHIDKIKTDRITAVFLPYKASMWDSLESVWKKAKEDDNCDAYVVPIPYYDKNEDGSIGKMYYEGSEFPEYVEIKDWTKFNLKEIYPDYIYIHNPYDHLNKVTTIHPDFYCSKIRNYTDCLVYIPYFVCFDETPKHFCVLPGTIYAHKVIVQDERARDTYVSEYNDFMKYNKEFQKYGEADDKFQALGSPKLDKIRNTKESDVYIPPDWLKKISNSDGTRKKIILYNTSIQALLDHKSSFIRKLKYVLNVFKKRQDVILLWRPHPLLEPTIRSMIPEILDEYKDIVERYKEEDWGIYDDTSDIDRAIVISSAYYGDLSSVVALYKVTGKPIMIEDMEIVE